MQCWLATSCRGASPTGHHGRSIAIEAKLTEHAPTPHDLRRRARFKHRLSDDLVDRVLPTAGKHAYRRQDGMAVVPLAVGTCAQVSAGQTQSRAVLGPGAPQGPSTDPR